VSKRCRTIDDAIREVRSRKPQTGQAGVILSKWPEVYNRIFEASVFTPDAGSCMAGETCLVSPNVEVAELPQ